MRIYRAPPAENEDANDDDDEEDADDDEDENGDEDENDDEEESEDNDDEDEGEDEHEDNDDAEFTPMPSITRTPSPFAWNLVNPDNRGWHHFDSMPTRLRIGNIMYMFTASQAERIDRDFTWDGHSPGRYVYDPDGDFPDIVQ